MLPVPWAIGAYVAWHRLQMHHPARVVHYVVRYQREAMVRRQRLQGHWRLWVSAMSGETKEREA